MKPRRPFWNGRGNQSIDCDLVETQTRPTDRLAGGRRHRVPGPCDRDRLAAGRPHIAGSRTCHHQEPERPIRAWWVMVFVFGLALLTGGFGSVILFRLTSFLALREFITLTPTKLSDHRSLFWAFFIITPLQYYLVAARWYGLFVVLIPVYAFLFIPIRSVIGGDCERFLERTAQIQWALMV